MTDGIACTVLVKVEYLNPGGSSKDRIALRIVDDAEAKGLLEAGRHHRRADQRQHRASASRSSRSSAATAACSCSPTRSARRSATCSSRTAPRSWSARRPSSRPAPESYYSVSDRLAREIPGAFKPDQYSNPNGPLSHYETTGPEIWRDTDGTVTHFVAGVGTGGTISGVGKYLKEQ